MYIHGCNSLTLRGKALEIAMGQTKQCGLCHMFAKKGGDHKCSFFNKRVIDATACTDLPGIASMQPDGGDEEGLGWEEVTRYARAFECLCVVVSSIGNGGNAYKYFVLADSSEVPGMIGVYPFSPIPLGDLHYTGVPETAEKRIENERKEAAGGDEGCEGLTRVEISDALSVQPAKLGGIAVMLNHSCQPNSRWNIKQDIGFISIIPSKWKLGMEMTWDYEATTDVKSEEIKCRCNGGKCKNMLVKYVPR
jgi:hypothetical protein